MSDLNIRIDCGDQLGPLGRFWCGTGMDPASLLPHEDMRQNIAYVGSIPHGGMSQIRAKRLLDLISAHGVGEGEPHYDFTALHEALDVLVSNGLKPVIELMGNPSGCFSDFSDDAQLHAWKQLIYRLGRHLIRRYGAEEVRSWCFEAWSESDIPIRWPQWPDNVQSFCNYYDACSEGLAEADKELRFGGPGACQTLSPMFKAFLKHCGDGTNYFTGKTGVRLDFISVHEKGARNDVNRVSRAICEKEIEICRYIRENHPPFADVAFMNTEYAQVAWADDRPCRTGPYYAAVTAKIIAQHARAMVDADTCSYRLLSNDNAFTGTWGNRTLTARFTKDKDGSADTGRFDLIKKPVLNVMTLMARLGETRLRVRDHDDPYADIGAIATRHGDQQVAVLLYNVSDSPDSQGESKIRLHLEDLPMQNPLLAHYRIDEKNGNPFALWVKMGRPPSPSDRQLAELRQVQELSLLAGPQEASVHEGALDLEFELPLPGVSLILLSARPADGPGQVTALGGVRYPGLNGQGQIMLKWTALESRLIRTHRILFAQSAEGPYRSIAEGELFCSAYLHADTGTGKAYYKVQAVDYWGRVGQAADLVVP